MSNREVMQQALEALEELNGLDTETESVTIDVGDVIASLKAALEQQAEPPPEWPLIKNILAVFGLDAIAFVVEWKAAQQQAEPVAWDKPSASFDQWWNGDYEDPANPFEKDSAAYWAWAGWQAAQGAQYMTLENEEVGRIEREIKYKLDSTRSTVVADDYYWIPIDASTPTNMKVLLLGRSGVATMGHYEHKPGETQFWEFWAPLPRKRT